MREFVFTGMALAMAHLSGQAAFGQPCQQGPEIVLRDSIGTDSSSTDGNPYFNTNEYYGGNGYFLAPVVFTASERVRLVTWTGIATYLSPQPHFDNADYHLRVWSSLQMATQFPTTGDLANLEFPSLPSFPIVWGNTNGKTTYVISLSLEAANIVLNAGDTVAIGFQPLVFPGPDASLGLLESTETGPTDWFMSSSFPNTAFSVFDDLPHTHWGRYAVKVIGAVFAAAGDMNNDGEVSLADVPLFVEALIDPTSFQVNHPTVPLLRGDMNCDAAVDGLDVQGFVNALLGP